MEEVKLLQPLGAIARLQSIWIGKYLLGEYALPSTPDMIRDIHLERVTMRKRYGNSPRHTMQVDFEPYVMSVQQEMRRGAKRPAKPLIERETHVAHA